MSSTKQLQKVMADKLIAQLCRDSYYQFFLQFWPLIAAEKLVPNWHIQKLCEELQLIAERVFKGEPKEYDFICNCPPGSSKSSIFSILWQPWVWTRMPSARFITGSYAERLALDLSRKSRDVVVSDQYRRMFPEIELREDQNTKGYFVNTRGGMRYAVGVGGSVIGMHAHFIVVDDPIDPQGVLSDLIINESNTWMDETLSQRKVDKQLTPTALVMQRLHQNDPTGNWLERGGAIKHYCLPGDTEWPIEPKTLSELYEDGLFDPKRFPRSVLEEEFAKLGETGYAGQYGQQPSPRGGSMFKVDRIRIKRDPPARWKRGPVRYWDKAATQGGGAWTVGVEMALDFEDNVWVLDLVRVQLDSGSRETLIVKTAKLDGKKCRIGMEQEPGGSGKESSEASCKRLALAGFRAVPDIVRDSKIVRADTFSVQVNATGVILLEADWNRTYINELRFFPNSRYKDITDASSGAFSMLTKARIKIGVL